MQESAEIKKSSLKKMGLKFWYPKFNILCKKNVYLFILPTLWSSKINKVILEQVKWQNRIMIICLIFSRNNYYIHKISSRNSTLHKFQIRFYLESLVSIHHLYHLFGIIYKSIFHNLNISLNYLFINKTINIRNNYLKTALGSLVSP